MTMRAARGDLVPGDAVWLIPRTLAAPPVCLSQPKAFFVRFDHPYVVVTVDGTEYRIHEDNMQRSDPHAAKRKRTTPTHKRPAMPDGWEEPHLW